MDNEITCRQLSQYCEEQAHILSTMAGVPPQRITNDNYISIRNMMHHNMPKDKVNRAVYDMTALLSLVSIVGYPEE